MVTYLNRLLTNHSFQILTILLLVSISCNSGGGGGAPIETAFSSDTLQDNYSWVEVGCEGLEHWSTIGHLEFDGVDNFTMGSFENTDGTTTQNPDLFGVYTVSSDGLLTMNPNVGPKIQGQIQKGGNLFFDDFTDDSAEGFVLGVMKKKGKISLDGEYFVVQFGFAKDDSPVLGYSGTGLITLDQDAVGRNGSYSGEMTTLREGIVDQTTINGTFSFKANGDVTWNDSSGSQSFQGGACLGGAFCMGCSATKDTDPSILLLMKRGKNYTTNKMQGDYYIIGIGCDDSNPAYVGLSGTIQMDGMGNMTGNVIVNEDDSIETESADGTYAISNKGELKITLTDQTGTTSKGGVSNDGSIAFVSTTSFGSDSTILVFLKKK